MIRKFFSEAAGTFLLVLIGCGSVCLHQLHGETVTNLIIALSFGMAVSVGIILFSKFSGAHMNPAVSLYFFWNDRLSTRELAVYVSAQTVGAFLAAVLLFLTFPTLTDHGSTLPKVGISNTWLLEFGLTAVLLFGVHYFSKYSKVIVALSIGGIVFLEALLFGPMTGASMNPARSLGPLLTDNNLEYFWIYLSSQLSASFAVIGCIKFIQMKRQPL